MDEETLRLLDKAREQCGPMPTASDLHWRALRIAPTALHWLRRSDVERYHEECGR